MGYLKYVKALWKKPSKEAAKERLMQWRREPSTIRIEKPTRIDRARSLGFKAKQGYLIVRQRVPRGSTKRPKITGGRRSKNYKNYITLQKGWNQVAEERAQKKYPNCTVLNSYWVGEDGKNTWYEVILVNRSHPAIFKDSKINWISTKRGRARRGLTSAGKKSRGLNKKGLGTEKMRPSKSASFKRKVSKRIRKGKSS